MNWYLIGVVVLGIGVLLYMIAKWLRIPDQCPKCDAEVIVWDYDRIVCSNPECNWEEK